MGLFGGKNSFFNKPLGKNSDASKVVSAVTAPARAAVNSVEALSQGNLEKAKNYAIGSALQMNPLTMATNSSSSLRKAFKSNGFTDQFVSTTDYSNRMASGKNLSWKQTRGLVGDSLENLAYVGAAAGAAGYFGAGSGAGTSATFGSKASYLGANTAFGAPAQAASTTGYLSGISTAGQAAAPSYLGASTSFGGASAVASGSGSFFSSVKSFAGESLKTLGSAYVTAAAMGGSRAPTGSYGSDGTVTSMPFGSSQPGVSQAGFDLSSMLPVVGIGLVGLLVIKAMGK